MDNAVEYLKKIENICRRFMTVPDGAGLVSPQDIAARIRSLVVEVARSPEFLKEHEVYFDDHPWIHDGICGVTRARVLEECELAQNPVGPSGEEWGIMARVTWGEDDFFDIPIGFDLPMDTAQNLVDLMEGAEEEVVDTDLVALALDCDFQIQFHADYWARLREIALDGTVGMDVALQFRRPAMWDIMRARLCRLDPLEWPKFTDVGFFRAFAASMKYDAVLARSNRALLADIAKADFEPYSTDWLMWHQSVLSILASSGAPPKLDGLSVILNFLVEEPSQEGDQWMPVATHNMVVAFGLHPLAAAKLLDQVKESPWRFYDLPDAPSRRFRLMGASAIQDTCLHIMRVTTLGRTNAYDLDREDALETAKVEEEEFTQF